MEDLEDLVMVSSLAFWDFEEVAGCNCGLCLSVFVSFCAIV